MMVGFAIGCVGVVIFLTTGYVNKDDETKIQKKKMLPVFLSLLFLIGVAFFAHGEMTAYAYPPAKKLPNTKGMSYREAFLAVAKSQLGYAEDKNGETVFGAWAGDSRQAWCSEFVAWCAHKARVPKTIIPKVRSAVRYREFFEGEGRFYLLAGGGATSYCGCRQAAKGTLSVDDLAAGDILLLDNHTCIFLYRNGNWLHTLDGNSGDRVCERDRFIGTIHGVCKPDFERKEKKLLKNVKVPQSMSLKKGKAKTLKLSLPKGLKKSKLKIRYKNSNKKIAVVNANGKVKAKKKGTCRVTTILKLQNGEGKSFKTKITIK